MEIIQGSIPTDASSLPSGLPSVLANAMLWLDAENIDGEMNNSLNDGDTVSEWKDLSGNISNLTQSTGSKQPTIISNSSKQFLSFDGSNDYLATNASGHILDNPSGQDVTIFTVVKPKSGYYILSTGGQATAATGYVLSYQVGNSFSTFKDNKGGRELLISDLFEAKNTNLVTHSYSGIYTNIDVLVNGSTSGSDFTHYNSSTNSFQTIFIGKPNNLDGYYVNFEIAEVVAIKSVDSENIIVIQYYLSN